MVVLLSSVKYIYFQQLTRQYTYRFVTVVTVIIVDAPKGGELAMTRRKPHEIPVSEQIGKLSPTAKLAMQLQDAPDVAAVVSRIRQRNRRQKGELITYSDGIYCRYYADSPQTGKRMKVSEFLCDNDTELPEQKKLLARRMKAVNLEQGNAQLLPTANEVTVEMYWDAKYYPVVKDNKSWSTALTYKRIFDGYLREHFATKSLLKYRTVDAHRFLEQLATMTLKDKKTKGLNRSSLGLCRAVCYGIFRSAKNKGLIEENPFADVTIEVKVRKRGQRVAYSLEEIYLVIQAIPRLDAKLLFSFCGLLGMRPSEAGAIRWEDITASEVRVCRSAPRGHEQDETKTDNSVRTLDLIKPVAFLVDQYREEWRRAGKALTGKLFSRRDGSVVDVGDFAAYNIAKYGRAAIGERWHGLYAGRRAVGTAQYNLTGDARSVFQTLGNENGYKYIQPSREQGRKGQALLEAAYDKIERKHRSVS